MAEGSAVSIPAPSEQPVKHRIARIAPWLVGIALLLLVCFYFGWSGGRELVGSSYKGAKVKAAAMTAERKQKSPED